MTRQQRIAIYSVIIFMMVWGLDLINAVKFHTPYGLKDMLHPLSFSQVLYVFFTFCLVMAISGKYFLTGKYVHFTIAILFAILFFIAFRYTLEEIIYPALFGIRNYNPRVSLTYYTLDNVYYALIYIVLGFLVFLLDTQVGNQKKQAILAQKSREAELQFLRSQINPHFLFNTLNNIYSLVYEKSEKAPAATLRLSEMMRYMLYEKKDTVPLAKEWEYINSFIELQKLRFDYEIPVTLLLEGNINDREIPPYLLIPFVENAFKHGDLRDSAVPLTIKLTLKNNGIVFHVQNKISRRNKDESGGVGLDNVKRRLELIFPGKHTVHTRSGGMIFEALLVLKM